MAQLQFDVRIYQRLGSTSDEIRRLAAEGASSGTVVCADEQTAGRGRYARRWFSPPGNLYLSLLLRPAVPAPRIAELGFVTALAVASTVNALLPKGVRPTLKWPNDVLVNGAKIAGILVEHIDDAVIVGIGINILHAPANASYAATTLVGCGGIASVDTARALLLKRLADQIDMWQTLGFAPIRHEWLTLGPTPGTTVQVTRDGQTMAGRFITLDEDGALLIETPQGRQRIITGEVVNQ